MDLMFWQSGRGGLGGKHLLNAPQLFGYTVFGKVVSGMDVVMKMKSTPTDSGGPFPKDVPRTPLVINSATLVK